jgi:hypothetical protein
MQRKPAPVLKPLDIFEQDDDEQVETGNQPAVAQTKKPLALSNLQSIIQTSPTAPSAGGERPWLQLNLIVKCMNGDLGDGKYSGKLGVVQRLVEGGFGGELRMVDSLDVIVLDQDECRPTLPAIGALVLIVAGEYAGGRGSFEALGLTGKDAVVKIEAPKSHQGRTLTLPLAEVCNFLP